MKIRKVLIEIRSLEDMLKEAGEVYEKIKKGKRVSQKSAIYFSNLKDMRKALTEKRLELLRVIRQKRPSSVYELAKITGRNIKNVLQDLNYLQRIGLVEITEDKGKKIPSVNYEKIRVEIGIS